MSYETELANIVHQTNVISDGITPALVQRPVVGPLIRYEALPVGTNVRLFRKDGYLVSEQVTESAAVAMDGSEQEVTQTSITATCVKLAAACILTVEAQQFSNATLADMSRYIGEAIARDWDDELKGLTTGFSTGVTATSVLTWDNILDGQYNVQSGTANISAGPLIAWLDNKGMKELRKEQWNSSAAVMSLPQTAQLLTGYDLGKVGFQGERGGVFFYQVTGLPTSSSDDVGLIYDPELAFGGMISNAPQVRMRWVGGSGSGVGFADEVAGWIFCDIVEWNDLAGCMLKSDT